MKKIMFNDKFFLTRDVLEGRKTSTRRIEGGVRIHNATPEAVNDAVAMHKRSNADRTVVTYGDTHIQICTRYRIGETVAIAQCYGDILHEGNISEETACKLDELVRSKHPGSTNKLYVNPGLMPHRLKIVDMKIERLQSISEEDCMSEGIRLVLDRYFYFEDNKCHGYYHETPMEAYATLIDKVSGEKVWERNPWVVAYKFEIV